MWTPAGEDGHVLKDFNLTIFCGEMLCLYGRHGSGKRVVRDILLGRRRMDSGSFFYEGKAGQTAVDVRGKIRSGDPRYQATPDPGLYGL